MMPSRSTAIGVLMLLTRRLDWTGCSKRLVRSSLGWTKPSCSRGRCRPRRKPSSRTTLWAVPSYYQASGTSRWRSPPALVERSRPSRSSGRACCQGLAEKSASYDVRDGLPERWKLRVPEALGRLALPRVLLGLSRILRAPALSQYQVENAVPVRSVSSGLFLDDAIQRCRKLLLAPDLGCSNRHRASAAPRGRSAPGSPYAVRADN